MYQIYIIKEFVQPKIEPQQGISYLERAREGSEREGGMGGWEGQQAVIFRIRFGRDRETEIERHRNKETKRQS